jgi:chemotaxis response regulator CheB
MPKVAREMGHVQEVVSLDDVAGRLIALVQEVTVYAGESDKAV